jgi:hypothetical protein
VLVHLKKLHFNTIGFQDSLLFGDDFSQEDFGSIRSLSPSPGDSVLAIGFDTLLALDTSNEAGRLAELRVREPEVAMYVSRNSDNPHLLGKSILYLSLPQAFAEIIIPYCLAYSTVRNRFSSS